MRTNKIHIPGACHSTSRRHTLLSTRHNHVVKQCEFNCFAYGLQTPMYRMRLVRVKSGRREEQCIVRKLLCAHVVVLVDVGDLV
jgi:hypothetical protein